MSESEEEWVSASAARAMGPSGTNFTEAILERARVGLVKARAALLVWDRQGLSAEPERDCAIPMDFWRAGVATENWDQGDFGVFGAPEPTSWMADSSAVQSYAYGVMFARADIQAMMPPLTESVHSAPRDATSLVAVAKNPGGRPPKDWEAAMIEMAGQLYDGDLKPDTQTSIEIAIKNYFSSKGIEIGDTTAKDHARPLFKRLTRKGEN